MIYLGGDTHGEFRNLKKFCEINDTSVDDVFIILGDAGINYHLDFFDEILKKDLAKLNITLFCVHGNHEERPELINTYKLKDWNNGQVYFEEEYPNILFAKDGEIYNLNGKQTIVIGGAYSVDKHLRLSSGEQWFSSEQPNERIKSYVEMKLEQVNWEVDYVLSHTTPLKYEPVEFFLPHIDQRYVDKSTEEWLDDIENKLDYQHWYCGHYHCDKSIDDITILYKSVIELK